MNETTSAYLPLTTESLDEEGSLVETLISEKTKSHYYRPRESRSHSLIYLVILLLSIVLVSTNLIWYQHTWNASQDSLPSASYWPGSERRVSKSLHWNTQYSDSNKTVVNALWKALFPEGQGVVSLPNSWATDHNLPISIRNRRNDSESAYFVAAYHELHCLSVIRAALYHYKERAEQSVRWDHTIHCLDSLRQNVMCRADDTLLYSDSADISVFGDGQVRVCRDWGKLEEWVRERPFHL